jgi:hypothetical protein
VYAASTVGTQSFANARHRPALIISLRSILESRVNGLDVVFVMRLMPELIRNRCAEGPIPVRPPVEGDEVERDCCVERTSVTVHFQE